MRYYDIRLIYTLRFVGHDKSESDSARVNGARLQSDKSADTEKSVTAGETEFRKESATCKRTAHPRCKNL